jgi:hypothetical protein
VNSGNPTFLEDFLSNTIDFVVLVAPEELARHDAQVVQRLHVGRSSEEFVAQFLDLRLYGQHDYPEPCIETHQVPRSFSVRIAGDDEPTAVDGRTPPTGGHPLRYTYASEIRRTTLPEPADQFDKAAMTYLNALDDDTVVVLSIF